MSKFSPGAMGVNHGGDGGRIPRICSGGTLIQVVPSDFCHFSKFQALAMDSSPPDFNPDLRHCLGQRPPSLFGSWRLCLSVIQPHYTLFLIY
jgi:hypothetical protein